MGNPFRVQVSVLPLMSKKSKQLGMTYGKARGILSRQLLFEFVQLLKKDVCFQCGEIIKTVRELSIDHKTPWLDSDNPKDRFFDTDNIAFSHLSCNSRAGKKVNLLDECENNPNSKLNGDAVIDIRCSKLSVSELSRKYGVDRNTIRQARDGITWKHIGR